MTIALLVVTLALTSARVLSVGESYVRVGLVRLLFVGTSLMVWCWYSAKWVKETERKQTVFKEG